VQVSDPQHGAPPTTAGKEEVRRAGDAEGPTRRAPPSRRFRNALERTQDDRGTGGTQDAASAAALAGWFRSESAGPPPATAIAVSGSSAASGPRAVDRVLIGSGLDGAEARIRIGAGALAGTEIQLTTGAAANVVEARLLTHAATSRQTLSLVMDEIRLRLRDRGIVLSTTAPGARRVARPGDVEAAAEGAASASDGHARSGG
jgi:hypothetical protein